jgi:acetyl-CoA carboxylase biotin carboxyl carrier protein
MAEKKQADLEKIQELVELMIKNDLVEIELIDGDSKIHLKRPQVHVSATAGVAAMPTAMVPIAEPAVAAGETKVDDGTIEIVSPVIGTFYSSPSPDSEPYAKVGMVVEPSTVVCIIEAMKVMNEIKAEVSGTIVEVLCKPGEAVEYGQALYKVKPS